MLALALLFLWRVIFSWSVNLIPDECSYWAWSRHLDWSYFDNSGMVAYLIRLSTEILGDQTPFSVRLAFLLLSGFTTYLIYRVSCLMFANRTRALFLVVLFSLAPVVLLGASAAIHDNALVFFWVLALWATARFLKSGDSRWFYVIGIAAGLSIQSKYTGILVLPCVLLFLLWSKAHRRLVLTKEPWLGALVSLIFALPILWWNVTHQWASLHHILFIGSNAVSMTRRIGDGIGYHLAQFLLVSPFFYVAMVLACCSAFARNIRRPKPEEILLLSFSLPLPLFGLLAFKGHVEANWAFMGYISASALAVEVILRAAREQRGGIWRHFNRSFFKWAAILAVGPAALVILHAWIGVLPSFIEKRIAKEDRIIWETRGWDGLGKHVGQLKRDGDVIAGDSYQLCALLEFNVPGQPNVRYLSPWKRPTQFDVWERSFDNLKGRNILYVSPRPLEPSSDDLTTIYENFGKVEALPPFKVLYHGVAIREVLIYRGYDFDPFHPRRLGPRSLLYKDYQ